MVIQWGLPFEPLLIGGYAGLTFHRKVETLASMVFPMLDGSDDKGAKTEIRQLFQKGSGAPGR